MTVSESPMTRRALRARTATPRAVFVDPSGRRARHTRGIVAAFVVGVGSAIVLAAFSVTAAPSLRAPELPKAVGNATTLQPASQKTSAPGPVAPVASSLDSPTIVTNATTESGVTGTSGPITAATDPAAPVPEPASVPPVVPEPAPSAPSAGSPGKSGTAPGQTRTGTGGGPTTHP